MNVIPIESKQIGYVEYDADRSCMIAHFTTGEIKIYPTSREEFAALGASSNKYDCFVRMTSACDARSAAFSDRSFAGRADCF